MKYELINNISGCLVLLVVTVVFFLLFESRYSKKVYLTTFIPFISILLIINCYVIFKHGFPEYSKYTLFIATIPSLIYFFIMAKYRNGKFFFTFCLVDTSSIWFVIVLGVFDFYIDSQGLFNALIRVAIAPFIIFITCKYFRHVYLKMLNTLDKGWWFFASFTILIYVILIVMTAYPTPLRDREDDIPLAFLIAILLPLAYVTMFYVLYMQQKMHETMTMKTAFLAQCSMIESKADQIQENIEVNRMERHNFRHKLSIIEELAKKGEINDLIKYIGDVNDSLDDTVLKQYCSNPILDAIFSSYFRKAENAHIKLTLNIALPDELPTPAAELATVFANIIENAINAARRLPEDERYIKFTVINKPTLMFELKNSSPGQIAFDKNGLPISKEEAHGIGIKSIIAFCKKYDAEYSFESKDNEFSVKIGL